MRTIDPVRHNYVLFRVSNLITTMGIVGRFIFRTVRILIDASFLPNKIAGAWEEFACYACTRLIGENKRKRDAKKLVLSFQGSVETKQCHSHNKKC